METIAVPRPIFRLTYNNKDISADLSPYLLQISYTDALTGESDDLQITLTDRDHRWKGAWFPDKGATLALSIGYEGGTLTSCGSFHIDEIELTGPPDTVSIRALAAGANLPLRTANSRAYENVTLRTIASGIAGRHGLALSGSGDALGRTYQRVTQHNEHDLTFLNRLGRAEGIVFKIADGRLVWHTLGALDSANSIVTIRRTEQTTFTFRAKTESVYKACQVSYHNPKTKKLVTHTETVTGVTTGDTLKLVERCETKDQVIARAKAALRNRNGRQVEGSISLPGNPVLCAGGNIQAEGFGVMDGKYQVLKATHTLDRSGGYTTDIELSTTLSHNKDMKNLRNLKRVTK